MYETIAQRLEQKGINASFQRVKIFEFLNAFKGHPTADQVHQELQKIIPSISKATIYNTLHLFQDNGLIKAVSTSAQGIHYDAILHQHGHFICNQCGKIYDFPCNNCGQQFNLEGFHIQSEEIVLKGICKHCSETKSA